jgi:hypothetical protein
LRGLSSIFHRRTEICGYRRGGEICPTLRQAKLRGLRRRLAGFQPGSVTARATISDHGYNHDFNSLIKLKRKRRAARERDADPALSNHQRASEIMREHANIKQMLAMWDELELRASIG